MLPSSATSNAVTGKSSLVRSVCGTVAESARTSSSPASGRSSPVSRRKSVVLPPPFGPRTAILSPLWTRKLTSSSASGPP